MAVCRAMMVMPKLKVSSLAWHGISAPALFITRRRRLVLVCSCALHTRRNVAGDTACAHHVAAKKYPGGGARLKLVSVYAMPGTRRIKWPLAWLARPTEALSMTWRRAEAEKIKIGGGIARCFEKLRLSRP